MTTHETSLKQPSFREVQRLRQLWVQLIVLGLAGLMWWALIQQLILRIPFGEPAMPDLWLLVFWLAFGLGLPIFIFWVHLIIEVYPDGVTYQVVPLHTSSHLIKFDDIRRAYVRTYRPLVEYGGWGIRYGWKRGRAYNMSGNQGVQLELVNGRRILLGSQCAEKLLQAMQQASGGGAIIWHAGTD